MKTFTDWCEEYEKNVGTKVHMPAWKQWYYHPEKGIFAYCINAEKQRFEIHEFCGDGRFLLREAEKIAKYNGCKVITALTRYPKPDVYCRLYNCHVAGYIMEKEVN